MIEISFINAIIIMVIYMKVVEAYTNSVYENFRTQYIDYWSFGNQILYDMCLKILVIQTRK